MQKMLFIQGSSSLPVAWQKRWKGPRTLTCCAWSLRKGGNNMTFTGSVPDHASGWVLVGEGEPLPTQDKKEVPVGGKGIGDEAV